MTIPFASYPVARVALFDGTTDGLRQIDSFASILGVRAAPFAQLDQLTGFSHSGYFTYIIDLPRLIYTGHGQGNRKIGDRIDEKATLRDSHIYLIYSRDERFNKLTAAYLEARLIDTAAELGIPLANGVRPFGPASIVSEHYEQLVQHTQFLLAVAGFHRFEKARRSPSSRSRRVSATGHLHDVRTIEPHQFEIPDGAIRKELVHRELRAEGYSIGNRLLILPGADYSYDAKKLSPENRRRRAALEELGVLEKVAGVDGRAKLTVGLDCKSELIAAKILTGQNIKGAAWRVVEADKS
jgi:hypothetical protein